MNARHPDARVRTVWPEPPDGCMYVEQSLAGGDYISTGYFFRGSVDAQARGRSVKNCRGVTSLFFDLDMLGLVDAARLARGDALPDKAADRKAHMYQSEVRVDVWRKVPHVWVSMPFLPESIDGINRIGQFLKDKMPC